MINVTYKVGDHIKSGTLPVIPDQKFWISIEGYSFDIFKIVLVNDSQDIRIYLKQEYSDEELEKIGFIDSNVPDLD